MRDPGDRRIGDVGMFEQDRLDLSRHDIVPAANDDFLLAPDDPQKAVGVEIAEVATVQPATGPGL